MFVTCRLAQDDPHCCGCWLWLRALCSSESLCILKFKKTNEVVNGRLLFKNEFVSRVALELFGGASLCRGL